MKEIWNDEEMTRPLAPSEDLWMLYDAMNPASSYDLIAQEGRAVVKANLGFDEHTCRCGFNSNSVHKYGHFCGQSSSKRKPTGSASLPCSVRGMRKMADAKNAAMV